MKKQNPLLALAFLLISACAGNSATRQSDSQSQAALPKANLPISADSWTRWQCADGNILRTRYASANGSTLILETATAGRHQLTREPGSNPAVYSDTRMAFYSDGQYAAIGRPLSDEVDSGGCTPERAR